MIWNNTEADLRAAEIDIFRKIIKISIFCFRSGYPPPTTFVVSVMAASPPQDAAEAASSAMRMRMDVVCFIVFLLPK